MPDEFDFAAWARLARADPAAFEAARMVAVEQAISIGNDPDHLRRMQWRLDAERRRARTPLKACLRRPASADFCDNRHMSTEPILQSTLTCPHCGHVKTETMPTDACQWFYECEGCHTLLKPLPGDCCVFCSYGDVPCPPIQASGRGGCCA